MSTSVLNLLIEKLGNNIEEIRVLALQEINGKLKNAGSDNDLVFNGPFLVKSLIRWFGNVPLRDEGTALESILLVLSSPCGGDIINFLKSDRILSELNKIEFFLTKTEHLKCLNEIREEVRRKVTMAEMNNSQSNEFNLDLNALTERLTLKDDHWTEPDNTIDLIRCWELPGTIDLNRMTALKHSLLRPETGAISLVETLATLPKIIGDMPGEYFLQPPYLYRNIFELLDAEPDLTHTIKRLNKNIIGRIKYRQLAATYRRKDERDETCCNQISISKYIRDCFKCTMGQFKSALSSNCAASVANQCLSIFTQLVEMAIQDPYGKTATYDDLMRELGNLCQYFRNTMGVNENKDFISRKYYLQILDNLVKLIRRRNISDLNYYPGDYEESKGDFRGPEESLDEHSWSNEIQIALLDVSIKIIYPELYESIVNSVNVSQLKNSTIIGTLLHCEPQLASAVNILRDWERYSNEELIYLGGDSLEMISIHESSRLIRILIKAINSVNGKFSSDTKLRKASEKVLLQLFSYPDTHLKRIVYNETANYMKMFFSSIVDGERSVAKLQKEAEKTFDSCNLGVPMTTEILTEILCVGYSHSDGQITAASETILTLIIKGRNVLGRYWKTLQQILIPVLPLLQAITNSYSSLGKSILEMFDPDPMELPFNDIFLGNIRFMFNEDASIRSEALIRLMYMVDSRPEAADYTPDVRKVSDTINDDVCIMEAAVDVSRRFCAEGNFDEASLYSSINMLKDSQDMVARKSALMMLNSMAMDPKLNLKIHDLDTWYTILVIIDNAMKVDCKADCPESVIPAVNLFSKMCIQVPAFRQEMAKEMKILILLIRGICKYHHMATFRPDCVVALFLLSHAEFVCGSINLSTPLLFSKLLLPFVAKSYHWIDSPFYKPSRFDETIAMLQNRHLQTARTTRSEPTSLYDFKLKLSAANAMGTNRSLISGDGGERNDLVVAEKEALWQFLRISWASLWFKGFDKLIESATEGLNYSWQGNPLDFNENLRVIKSDISLIVSTNPTNAFKCSVTTIQNATTHSDVVNSLVSLESVLKLNPKMKFNMKSVAKSLQRFCLTIPSTPLDEELFGEVVAFLTAALQSDNNNDELQGWAVKEFKQSHCNFVDLLSKTPTAKYLFERNVRFLQRLLSGLVDGQRFKEAKRIATKLMNHVLEGIEARYADSELEFVNNLLLLLRTILHRLPDFLEDYSEEFSLKLADRLLAYSVTSKISSRMGSEFLKNILTVICKLGKGVEKFTINRKHYNLIIGLTGHVDIEIRVLAWNLLEKLSSRLETAKGLPEELIDIPGGLHNFALSTATDEFEADLVREVSAVVFANLISYIDPNGQVIICPVSAERRLTEEEIPLDVLMELLNRHKFIDQMMQFIRTFSPTELLDIECNETVTYCGTIRGHVKILTALLRLEESILEEVFFTTNLGLELINLISLVPADVTPNSLEMTAEICKLLLLALNANETVRERIILSNGSIVGALVYLLNVNIYTNSIFLVNLWSFGIYFLEMLRQVIATDHGYGILCQVLEQNENGRDFMKTLLAGLQIEDENLQIGVLSFLGVALNQSINCDSSFRSFLTMMDLETGPVTRKFRTIDPPSSGRENLDPNKPPSNMIKKSLDRGGDTLNEFALLIQLLFDEVHHQFRTICHSQKGPNSSKKKTMCLQVLAQLLNASELSRSRANAAGLYDEIIVRYKSTMGLLGSSSADFVRRHGEVKKIPIMEELEMLFDILIGWFAVETLVDLEQVESLAQLIIKSWSHISTNQKLQLKLVRLLVILSEDSVPICKSFVRQYSTVSSSVVHLLGHLINQEMAKVKHPKFNLSLLRIGVRVLINCCSCVEGRILLGKLNIMDHMDRLHPQVTKWQEPWVQLTELWLEFWEIYSRYPEGGRLTHQSLLFTIVHRGKFPKITEQALTILRNMAFQSENRISILNSEEYVNMIKYVLDSEAPNEQLLLVIVSIWKLIANSYKAKNKLKSTTIPSKLISLKNRISTSPEEPRSDEILFLVDIVNSILIS